MLGMAGLSSSWAFRSGRSEVQSKSFSTLKEQALVLDLTQRLAEAQIERGDAVASQGLWNEIAALEIDPERIIHLLYNRERRSTHAALRATDDQWMKNQQPEIPTRGWLLKTLSLF